MQWTGSLWVLDGASTALAHQLPRAVGSASSLVAVPATAVRRACIAPYGQHCGCRMLSQLAALRALQIPGELNRAADALSRQLTFPGEWRLHPPVRLLTLCKVREDK